MSSGPSFSSRRARTTARRSSICAVRRPTSSQCSESRSSARSKRAGSNGSGSGTHISEIVASAPDNIPRPMGMMGFRRSASPPIEQTMLPADKPHWLPLGALLVRENLITSEQLELALIDQQGTGLRLGELLVQWGWVESAAISRALAEQYDMAFLDLDEVAFDPEAVRPARRRGRRGTATRSRSARSTTASCSSASPTRPTSAPARSCARCSAGRSAWSSSTSRRCTARSQQQYS